MIRIIFSLPGPFTSPLAPVCPLARGYLLQQVHVQGVSFQHPVFLNDFSPLGQQGVLLEEEFRGCLAECRFPFWF